MNVNNYSEHRPCSAQPAAQRTLLQPPSPLPENAPKRSTQTLRGIRHIVRLSELFADTPPNNIADIRGVSDTTGKLPTFMTMDATGRILRSEGDVLKPTSGFVHIIPEELVTPADLKRSRESCLFNAWTSIHIT
jgi:hypothetical protein